MEARSRRLEQLSPFQLKDELIRYAKDQTQDQGGDAQVPERRAAAIPTGSPPRRARRSSCSASSRSRSRSARWDEPELRRACRSATASRARLRAFLDATRSTAGAALLRRALDYATSHARLRRRRLRARARRRDHRRQLPRPRSHARPRRAGRAPLPRQGRCATTGRRPGSFDLFAVEGGTAAMCYVFKSLVENRILHRGDTIALGTPIFTPYIEMPHLERLRLQDRRGRAERDGGRPPHLAVPGRRAREARGSRGSRPSSSSTRRTRRRSPWHAETQRADRRARADASGPTSSS